MSVPNSSPGGPSITDALLSRLRHQCQTVFNGCPSLGGDDSEHGHSRQAGHLFNAQVASAAELSANPTLPGVHFGYLPSLVLSVRERQDEA